MPVLHISPNNSHTHADSISMLKNAPIAFVLIYMEGCGPCEQVRPEWAEMSNDESFTGDVIIADIDQALIGDKVSLKNPPSAFPNIRCISTTPTEETYEEYDGPRNSYDIKKWIKSKTLNKSSKSSSQTNRHNSISFRGGYKSRRFNKRSGKRSGKRIGKRTCKRNLKKMNKKL